MAKKQSSSQVSCGEVIALSAEFTNDANQYNMELIFNTSIFFDLVRIIGEYAEKWLFM